jgi:uncharacterized protein
VKITKILIIGIATLVAGVSVYLLVIAVIPGFDVPRQPLNRGIRTSKEPGEELSSGRTGVSFTVRGVEIRAWLYVPAVSAGRLPCIVMASGLGGTKDMGDAYARRFQEAGFVVLSFDYRYFGESGGEPRQLIWIPDQLEDWAAAVDYARGIPGVDPSLVALWGTSLSGGHVIVTAAKDHRIACLVAQCPGVDGRESAELAFDRLPLGYNLRMLMHGQRDLVRSWLGLSPHKVPIVGKPGSIALMTTSNAFEAFGQLTREQFVNEACARIIIRGDKYRPVKYAQAVQSPVFLQICENDRLVSAKSIEETGKILGYHAQVVRYPIGHFDVYFGRNFEASVRDQIAFFKKHLWPEPAGALHRAGSGAATGSPFH